MLCRPELIHPFASAIDTELEIPEEMVSRAFYSLARCSAQSVRPQVVVMMNSKPPYVRLPEGKKHVYQEYPPDSLEGWHKKHNLYVE